MALTNKLAKETVEVLQEFIGALEEISDSLDRWQNVDPDDKDSEIDEVEDLIEYVMDGWENLATRLGNVRGELG